MRPRDDEVSVGIEFVAPDASAFGDSQQADFVGFDGASDAEFGDGPRVPRKVSALAGMLVLGLIAVGIVAAAQGGDESSSPTTTTSPKPASTTVSTLPSNVMPVGEPGYIIDSPEWKLLTGGPIDDLSPVTRPLDVFTLDGSPSSDQWVVVGLSDPWTGELREGAIRFAIGDRVGIVSDDADGATHITLPDISARADGPRLIDIRASSTVPFDELVELAAAVTTDGSDTQSGLAYGSTLPRALAEMTLAWSGKIADGDVGPFGTAEAIAVCTRNDSSEVYAVRSRVERSLVPYADLLLSRAPDVDGVLVDGVYMVSGGLFAANVQASGTAVAVLYSPGGLGPSELRALAGTMRLATADEWRAVQAGRDGQGSQEGSEAYPPMVLQSGRLILDDVDVTWYSQISTESMYISTDDRGWNGTFRLHDGIEVRRFSATDVSVILITAYWPSTARSATVTIDGAAPVEVTLEQMGDEPVWAALVPYTELADATVDLRDADGQSLGQVRVGG
ncbi:MAG: hypothetical protein ACOYL9_13635 [Ilumatobacteraceae bacterium]